MDRRPASPGAQLLGADHRVRMRVSQSLLGVPSLLLIHALLIARWQAGQLSTAWLACFVGTTLAGCAVFVALLRSRWSERLSAEPSLSAPQMVYAMCCVGWGYALAGSMRALLLCLMPVILCFGLFALRPPAARALAAFGVLAMGLEMGVLAFVAPDLFDPHHEAAHFGFLLMSMSMVQALSLRLGQMRARLNAQKAELTEALERISLLATRDVLTGLLNRRAAQDELRRAAGQAARGARPLAVALIDLDHFKKVNDRFGHQAGDAVLQRFAQVAERVLRGSDRVARWGGEEFLVLMPDTAVDDAQRVLERLRRAYAQAPVEGVTGDEPLGFSAGVATCSGPVDIDAAVERADRALYRAKLAGRGRTQAAAPEGATAA